MKENKTGESQQHPAALEIDVEYYQSLIDHPGISADEKRKLVEALWGIMTNFVDLGFGIHPIQQTQASEGTKLDEPNHTNQLLKINAPIDKEEL